MANGIMPMQLPARTSSYTGCSDKSCPEDGSVCEDCNEAARKQRGTWGNMRNTQGCSLPSSQMPFQQRHQKNAWKGKISSHPRCGWLDTLKQI
jgi:hypothetical protein